MFILRHTLQSREQTFQEAVTVTCRKVTAHGRRVSGRAIPSLLEMLRTETIQDKSLGRMHHGLPISHQGQGMRHSRSLLVI